MLFTRLGCCCTLTVKVFYVVHKIPSRIHALFFTRKFFWEASMFLTTKLKCCWSFHRNSFVLQNFELIFRLLSLDFLRFHVRTREHFTLEDFSQNKKKNNMKNFIHVRLLTAGCSMVKRYTLGHIVIRSRLKHVA